MEVYSKPYSLYKPARDTRSYLCSPNRIKEIEQDSDHKYRLVLCKGRLYGVNTYGLSLLQACFWFRNIIWLWSNESHVEVVKLEAPDYRFIALPGYSCHLTFLAPIPDDPLSSREGDWFVFPFSHIIQKF